jgi:hypothetical protein
MPLLRNNNILLRFRTTLAKTANGPKMVKRALTCDVAVRVTMLVATKPLTLHTPSYLKLFSILTSLVSYSYRRPILLLVIRIYFTTPARCRPFSLP